ncbi:MAG: glycine cleavage system protein H [Halobacteriovoraceae bacterium]|nr:glycine cleavage system protein H [Halobacteriovoraceae bacterium]|tara:strand:- start:10025 stop:10408 length:384 start_codon:yes stop_codon:yes gene_type:complete
MSKIIDGYLYTEEHEWIHVEGETATIGITDFAQSSLGDIVFVELPEEGEELEAGNSFGVVESIKSVSDLYTPLTGKVVEKNSTVEETPENLNEDPYGGWLIKMSVNDSNQLDSLMDSNAYKEFCESL